MMSEREQLIADVDKYLATSTMFLDPLPLLLRCGDQLESDERFIRALLGECKTHKDRALVAERDKALREPTDEECMAIVHANTVFNRKTHRDSPDTYDLMRAAVRWAILDTQEPT